MTKRKLMALVAQAFLWTGSQIPVYLLGAVPPYIYRDIGGHDRWIWLVLANLLSLAAVCPFVGSLSDLFGRRYVAMSGAAFIVLGMIIVSTAKTMNIVIGGMVFAGIGAGINELTALAATSELAPTAKRGKYVGILVFTIVPFCPSVLYGQLIAYYSSWRYIGLLCAVWAFIGLVLTAVFYFPPPPAHVNGSTRREILGQIDFVGGLLSISGMILFSECSPQICMRLTGDWSS
jgi:MFS family permease